jgi:diguanylate cyclase (GGDEF)-like protein
MDALETLLAMLAVATVALVAVAALTGAALLGRGPFYGRILSIGRQTHADDGEALGDVEPVAGIGISPSVRLLARGRRTEGSDVAIARRAVHPSDGELDEVLQGPFAAETFNRAVRVLAWSFILAVLATVSVSQLWQPVEPQIFVTLTLAGVSVLVLHEFIPPGRLGTLRIVLEGSGAILFLTILVLLTGDASSPFFFVYPLLVCGAALVASPTVTLLLTVETAVAYGIAAFSGPLDGDAARDALARVAINLTALVLLAYAGLVISRVQRRTRDAAIRLSTVDSLTDLYNRAYLFNSVDREIQRSRRFKRGFCLLMMDLDGLKSINDRYGHYQGDLVLRGVARVIRSGLRGIDVPARYGGDEFVALLPETDPSGAYVVAEKIRQAASEMTIETGGQQIKTSLSIGVVSYPEDGRTADELMIAADEAMYSSKSFGKNKVVGYADPDDLTAPFLAQPYRPSASTSGFRPFEHDAASHREWETGELERGERKPGEREPGERERMD